MKRHPALIPLSREHHQVLILAQLLKTDAPDYKGLPKDPNGKTAYALEIYQSLLKTHMQAEEKVLFTFAPDEETREHITHLTKEHALIRDFFAQLEQQKITTALLNALGELLEAHVRYEERIFFQYLQQKLTEEDMTALGSQLETAREGA